MKHRTVQITIQGTDITQGCPAKGLELGLYCLNNAKEVLVEELQLDEHGHASVQLVPVLNGMVMPNQRKNDQEITYVVSKELTKPLPVYSHATVCYGDLVYVSAIQGFVPGTFEFPEGGVSAEAEQMMKNFSVILRDSGSEFSKLLQVTLFFTNMSRDLTTVNDIFNRYVPNNSPARSSIEVSSLPRGANVVIDCVAVVKK